MRLTVWKLALPVLASVVIAPLALPDAARAERLSNPVAEFAGIDKITGRITTFDVYVNETVQFGALQVTPKVCYSRDETEAQKIDAFIEVDEITLDRKIRRIFSGWMFADSPALNAVEHPIYDVWLTGCKVESEVPPPPGVEAVARPAPEPAKPADAATPAPTAASVQPGAAVIDPTEGTAQEFDPNQTALPPLDAPVEVPDEVIGDAPADLPPSGDPLLQGNPAPPPAPLTPPGSVGLF